MVGQCRATPNTRLVVGLNPLLLPLGGQATRRLHTYWTDDPPPRGPQPPFPIAFTCPVPLALVGFFPSPLPLTPDPYAIEVAGYFPRLVGCDLPATSL